MEPIELQPDTPLQADEDQQAAFNQSLAEEAAAQPETSPETSETPASKQTPTATPEKPVEKPTEPTQEVPEVPTKPEPGMMTITPEEDKERYNQFGIGALNYLQDGKSIGGNPLQTFKEAENLGKGIIDFPMDAIRYFGDPGKQISQAWDDFSKRDERRNNLFSAAGQQVVPILTGNAIASWLGSATRLMNISNSTRAIGRLSSRLGIEVGAPQLLQSAEEPGLFSSEGDGPRMNRIKNAAFDTGFFGLGEVIGAIANSNGMRQYVGTELKDVQFLKKRDKAFNPDDPIVDPASKTKQSRFEAEMTEARKAFESDPERTLGYNAFVNEPNAVPGERLVKDYEADPVGSLADRAVMKTDLTEETGQARPFFTDNFLTNLMNAPKGSARRKLIEEQIEASEISFKTVLPSGEEIPAEVMERTKNDIWKDLLANEDADFSEALKEYQFTDNILGRPAKVLTQTAKQATMENIDELLFYLNPKNQRVEALAAKQAAEGLQDLSILEAFKEQDPKRIRELIKPRLQLAYEAARRTQYVEGLRLRLNDITDQAQNATTKAEKAKFDRWKEDLGNEFDVNFKRTKAEALEFVNTFVDLADESPQMAEAFRKAFILSDGKITTLKQVVDLAKSRTNAAKFIYTPDTKEADFFSKAVEQYTYQNLLNGRTPIRTFISNLNNLLLKPSTSLIGSGLRLDVDNVRKTWIAYGVGMDGLLDMARMARTQFKYSQLYPDYQMTQGLRDVYSSRYVEEKPIIDAVNEAGKLPMYNQVGWWMTTAFKKVQDHRLSRLGVSLLSGVDGFNNGWLAHVNARFETLNRMDADGVLDKIMEIGDNPKLAKELEKTVFKDYKNGLVNSYLDEDGLINDEFTKIVGQEINLNGPNNATAWLNNGLSHSPLFKGFVKFLPTLGNAFTYNLTFVPFASTVLKRHRKLFFPGGPEGKKEAMELFGIPAEKFSDQRFKQLQNEHLGRWAVFSSFAITAGVQASMGNTTGYGPRNAEERKDWLRFNKPYHFKRDGKWYSYENMGPITTALGFATDLNFELNQGNISTDDYIGAFFSLYSIFSNNVLNTSTFFDSLEPLNAILVEGDPNKISKGIANYLDQYNPMAGMRSWANSINSPEYKELDRNFWDYVANRSKFITKLPNQIDIYDGSKIAETDGFATWYNSLMPFLRYGGEASPMKTFLANTPWSGGFKPYSIDGVQLNKFEKERLNTIIAGIGKEGEGDNKLTREITKIMKDAQTPGTRAYNNIKQAKEIMRQTRTGQLSMKEAQATISKYKYAEDLIKIHNKVFNQAKGILKRENDKLADGLKNRIKAQKQAQIGARRGQTQQVNDNLQILKEYNSP